VSLQSQADDDTYLSYEGSNQLRDC